MPVPERLIVCVEPATLPLLSVRVRVPFLVPAAVGVKVTAMLQDAPAARVKGATGQALEAATAKSPALVPVMAMLAMFSVLLPMLVSMTF